MLYRKRIAVLFVLIALLLAVFWLGSRFPAIDEKAAMAGEVVLEDVLSFEATFETSAGGPLWKRVSFSTLNWMISNRQGMTFGVLLASLILTLLQFWPVMKQSGRAMWGILKGVLIGAPLGVCVNCAAPIAYGMRKQGVQHETSLATMFAAPSLNIVVVTMMFSLLPFYMAVTKLAVTFIFLLILLPLLLRLGHREETNRETVTGIADEGQVIIESRLPATGEKWLTAVCGLGNSLLRNLLFIVVRTVPLMFLAGFLGAFMANVLPMESFASWQVGIGAMVLVALLGTFAPVPIAFDIVVVQALLVIGLPPPFAMVLLITLGLFSIYPFMLVVKMLSLRFSAILFFTVTLLGVSAGYFAVYFDDFQRTRNQQIFKQHFAGRTEIQAEPIEEVSGVSSEAADQAKVPDSALNESPTEEAHLISGGIRIEQINFRPRSLATRLPFYKHDGRSFGLLPTDHQFFDLMLPFSQGRGIASADFDGDGWTDLVIANNQGVSLFRNLEGRRFERVPLNIPQLEQLSVLVVAFADMNNDGCIDLFIGGFGGKDYFLVNDCHGFVQPALRELTHGDALMTQAVSFADYDRDGDLDFVKGSWFFLMPRAQTSARNVNYLVDNLGNFQFRQNAMDEIYGATLAVLLSDFDNDGLADLIIGNDYMEPDIHYRGSSQGAFKPLQAGGIIPVSTLATMSIDTADIDNDLDLDIFLSGKVNDFSIVRQRNNSLAETKRLLFQRRKDSQQRYCSEYAQPLDLQRCELGFAKQELMRGTNIAPCKNLATSVEQDDCMITIMLKNAVIYKFWDYCPEINADEFPVHRKACEAYRDFETSSRPKVPGYQYLDQGAVRQTDQGNVLLVQLDNGQFVDKSKELGVFDGHWAWTAKFADLDNDEWQDLFLVNGWWLESSLYSNKFFHNEKGQRFESKEAEFGLESIFKQHAFTYLDMDRDGDLDIITRSLSGDMQVYINGLQGGHSVMFEFRDRQGNFFGIGNKITIYYGENDQHHQVRELKSGGGFVSFDAPFIHFGLGKFDRVNRLVINWSDGGKSEIHQVFKAGKKYVIFRDTNVKSLSKAQTPIAYHNHLDQN